MTNYEHEIVIGALLRDIGKFWRQAKGIKKSHPYLSSKFVREKLPKIHGLNFDLLETIVCHHYENKKLNDDINLNSLPKDSIERKLAGVVCEAECISSAWDWDQRSLPETSVPLESVFSSIALEHKKGLKTNEMTYFPLLPLSPQRESLFPSKTKLDESEVQAQLSILWDQFVKELSCLSSTCFEAWYQTLLFLLQKYTSHIPSATAYMNKFDIPMYNHAKTTAAIAVALWHYIQEYGQSVKDTSGKENRFLVIRGDISGIQSYIYKVRNPQEARKGTAKRLRGRSLTIELLLDCFAGELLQKLGLFKPNLLLLGGGNFLILAPNLEKIRETILEEYRKDSEDFFYKNYEFDLYLAISSLECSKNDLRNFGQLNEKLWENVAVKKRQKYQFLFDEEFFEPQGSIVDIEKTCPACSKELTQNICLNCETHTQLSQHAVRAKYLVKNFSQEDLSSLSH